MLSGIERTNATDQAIITVFIFCGGVIQILPTIASLPVLLTELTSSSTTLLFPADLAGILAYFVTTLAYCYVVAQVLIPRRMPSPILIQLVGVFLTFVIVLASFVGLYASQLQKNSLFYTVLASQLAISLLISGIFAFLIGLIQYLLLRRILGLSFNSIDTETFFVDSPYSDTLHILQDKGFLDLHNLAINEETPTVIALSRSVGFQRQILVATPSDAGTILCSVAFEVRYETITKTLNASDTMLDITRHIKGRLEEHKSEISFSKRTGQERATRIANALAMKGAESAFGIVKRFSAFQKVISIGIILFLVLTSYLYSNHQLSGSNYFEGLTVVVIGGILGLAPLVADTLRERSAFRKALLE